MYQVLINAIRHGNGIFEMGEVVGLDTMREQYNDGTGNTYPTGLIAIRVLSTDAVVKVPHLMPGAGKSQFFGCLPETGALALLANLSADPQTASYIVLGFLPVPINKMVAVRKEMQRLTSGEVLIQGSANGIDDFWRSANMKIDEYGRLLIHSGDDDLQIIVGDMLSNEYTPQVAVVKDELTGATVIYKMKMGGNDTTVTRDGSLINRWNRILQEIAGDWLTVLKGKFVVTSGQQIRLAVQGNDANYINIDGKTGISMKALSKFTVDAGGRIDIASGDALALAAFLDMALMAGGNMQMKVVKNYLVTAANISMIATADKTSVGNAEIVPAAAGIVALGAKAITPTLESTILGDTFFKAFLQQGSLLDGFGLPVTKPLFIAYQAYLTKKVKVI